MNRRFGSVFVVGAVLCLALIGASCTPTGGLAPRTIGELEWAILSDGVIVDSGGGPAEFVPGEVGAYDTWDPFANASGPMSFSMTPLAGFAGDAGPWIYRQTEVREYIGDNCGLYGCVAEFEYYHVGISLQTAAGTYNFADMDVTVGAIDPDPEGQLSEYHEPRCPENKGIMFEFGIFTFQDDADLQFLFTTRYCEHVLSPLS